MERLEGGQNPLVHEGAEPDRDDDTNERGDDKVDVVQPDGSPVPRYDDR